MSYFPDKEVQWNTVQTIRQRYPGTFVISHRQISHDLSTAVKRQMIWLSMVAGILVLSLTLMVFRNLRLTMTALIPVVSGLVTVGGVLGLSGNHLNAAGLMAAVMVMGLCIDYGIFMVYAARYRHNSGTGAAVAASAATTAIGAAALLLAGHPALFNIGLVLVSGIAGGFAASVWVVPMFSHSNENHTR